MTADLGQDAPLTHDRGARLEIVDGLRAVAVIAVVLFHSVPAAVPGGFIGVDVFFVISGFVITLRYLDDLITKRVGFTTFFARRVRRLLPAYVVLIATVTLAAATLLQPRDLVNFGTTLAAQAVYAQNIAFWQIGDYFDAALAKPLLHTWSLAIEEQFYLLFPVAILAMRRWRRIGLALLLLIAVVSIAAGLFLGPISPKSSFYWLPFRMWEFLAGLFTAIAWRRRLDRRVSAWAGATAVSLGIAGILGAGIAFDGTSTFPGAQAFIAVTGTVAVCLFQTSAPNLIHRLFASDPVQYAGRISYSWYLWHWPPLAFHFLLVGHAAGPAAALVIGLCSLGIAIASYEVVEQRGLRWTGLAKKRPAFAWLSVFLVACAGAGAALAMTDGLIGRYPPRERALLAAQMDRSSYRCPLARRLAAASEEICRLNDVGGPGGVLIVGDSHADQAKDVIAAMGQAAGVPVFLVKQNCQFVDYGHDGTCPLSGWETIKRDVARHGVRRFLIISHWRDAPPAWFPAGFERLRGLQGQIWIRRATPEGPELDPASYLHHPNRWSDRSGYPLARHQADHRALDALFRTFAASEPAVRVLDPVPLLCTGGLCRFASGGRPLYFDSNHLTPAGERIIASIYRPVFR